MNELYRRWLYPTSIIGKADERWWQFPVRWWFSLTAPAISHMMTFLEREVALQARLTSATLFFTLVLAMLALPLPITFHNWALLCALLITMTLHGVALALNRHSRIVFAGIVAVCAIDVGLCTAILSVGKLTISGLPLFDLMVQSVCVAVSLLPPRSVFVVAIWHCVFFVLVLIFLPHSAYFNQILAIDGYDIFLKVITIQLIVAVVTYLWARNNQRARQRLYQAETIAHAEHTIARRNGASTAEIVQLQRTRRAVERLASHLASVPVQEWESTGTLVDVIAHWIIKYQDTSTNPAGE